MLHSSSNSPPTGKSIRFENLDSITLHRPLNANEDGRNLAKVRGDSAVKRFEEKYPKAMTCLVKDKTAMLAFYDFPAEHWLHIRTSNPIESTFSTVRLRTTKTRNCVSRESIFAMVFKLVQGAEKRWKRLHGFVLMADIIEGVEFKNGVKQVEKNDRNVSNQ